MAGFSKYPAQLDSSLELPLTTDNVTPVKAEVINRIRDCVFAIESELGINPSGTYGSVRARLDAISSGSGGGGGGAAIAIQLNGTEITPSAVVLDFVGNVDITLPQPLTARIQVIGGQAQQVQESLSVSFNGQTIFSLSQTPIQVGSVLMFVNGLKQTFGVDYTVSVKTVTYIGAISLSTSDNVEFWYLFDMGGITASDPAGPANGDLSGTYPNPTVARFTAAVTNVSSTSYNVFAVDFLIAANSTSNAIAVNLPSSPVTGRTVEVKDANGTSATHNITVNGNGHNIDGSSSFILSSPYASLSVRFNGTKWSIV